MFINGVHIKTYGALLEYGYKITGVETETSYNSYGSLICLGQKFGRKRIDISIFISEKTHEKAEEKRSALCNALLGTIDLIMPGGNRYKAVLTDMGQEEVLAPGKIRCGFTLIGTKYGPKQVITGNRVYCESTLPKTDCILTATAVAGGNNYKLGSVTFPTVAAGEVLCVDGITKRILINGAPAAQRAEWLEFPYLVPGENNIECVDEVTVEFYPAYF